MTQAEADAALARIGDIVREGAVGVVEDDWDRARAALEEELREAAEALRAVVCEDGDEGALLGLGTAQAATGDLPGARATLQRAAKGRNPAVTAEANELLGKLK